jgi:3-methyladenine DNA glycosylase AlkD
LSNLAPKIDKELKKLGTAQNRKIYIRHGSSEPLYGVSFKHLKDTLKKYKGSLDIVVIRELWDTENYDLRIFAMMAASPEQVLLKDLNKWVKQVDCTTLAGYFGALVAKTKYAEKRRDLWMKSPKEFIRDSAYSSISSGLKDGETISKTYLTQVLKKIESDIHKSKNFSKQAMNNTLIAIGVFREDLRKAALKTATKIGKVHVDHGLTNCKTPDAKDYILSAVEKRSKMKKHSK